MGDLFGGSGAPLFLVCGPNHEVDEGILFETVVPALATAYIVNNLNEVVRVEMKFHFMADTAHTWTTDEWMALFHPSGGENTES